MHDRQDARDAHTISRLRSLQKAAERQALAEARARAETQFQGVETAKRGLDEAVAFWVESADKGAVIDPARLALASLVLARSQDQLAAADDLHHQALEAVESQRRRVQESLTHLKLAEQIEDDVRRRLQRQLDERRQTVIEDRVAFDWSSHG